RCAVRDVAHGVERALLHLVHTRRRRTPTAPSGEQVPRSRSRSLALRRRLRYSLGGAEAGPPLARTARAHGAERSSPRRGWRGASGAKAPREDRRPGAPAPRDDTEAGRGEGEAGDREEAARGEACLDRQPE